MSKKGYNSLTGLSNVFKKSARPTNKSSQMQNINPVHTACALFIDNTRYALEGKRKCDLILEYIKYKETLDKINEKMSSFSQGGASVDCVSSLSNDIQKKYEKEIDIARRKSKKELIDEIIKLNYTINKFVRKLEKLKIKTHNKPLNLLLSKTKKLLNVTKRTIRSRRINQTKRSKRIITSRRSRRRNTQK